MSVGFFVYILVFSKKKIQRKTQRCLQNGAKKKHANTNVSACFLVRVVGVEPTRLAAQEPKSCASANSTIPANMYLGSFKETALI
jgi:hypothetical protein